jgi:RNA-directed DNA polymerase
MAGAKCPFDRQTLKGHGPFDSANLIDLVLPLPHQGTAMHTTETTHNQPGRSGAVSALIGDRGGDVDSENQSAREAYAWIQNFNNGNQNNNWKNNNNRARAVRSSYQTEPLPSFQELVEAYFECRKGKRNSDTALAFEANLERNLCALHASLINRTYTPGRSICFVITRPKPREVWAAGFEDRIVHHLLYRRIGPRFENSFIADSCACIKGRGTLYGAIRLEAKVRSITENWSKPAFYLKCDLTNFFVAINKAILMQLLEAKVQDPWWHWLTMEVLLNDPRINALNHASRKTAGLVPEHKRLGSQDNIHGLPIGNLSSQFFANVYLNELDQFVKHQVRAKHYIRYVDDFVLLHESPQWLNSAKANIEWFLAERLQARLNPSKTILQPIERGIDFVGQVIRPWHRTTRKRTVNVAFDRVQKVAPEDRRATVNSYFGLMRQASKSHHLRSQLAKVVLKHGHAVDGEFTKAFERKVK